MRADVGPLRRSQQFRLLFTGQVVSFAGSMFTYVALPYQAYQLGHSSLIVGLLSLAEVIPYLFIGLVGGAFADAVDRRRVVVLTEAGLAICAVALIVNAAVAPQLWVLFMISFLMAVLGAPCNAPRLGPFYRASWRSQRFLPPQPSAQLAPTSARSQAPP